MRARRAVAEVTGAELVTIPGGGHNPARALPRESATSLILDFLDRAALAVRADAAAARPGGRERALYLSSPIGLGHARRDIAIARELRKLRPDLQVDWLAQDPVTRLLDVRAANASTRSARGSPANRQHIELESGDHELHAFQAIRRMDEVLIANFMIFQDAVEQGDYDLVIADEAWEVDHYWHEHPELKKAKLAWLTDFVGYVPMPAGGEHEAFLSTDYNAEMIEHVERHPGVRDRAIFVGEPRGHHAAAPSAPACRPCATGFPNTSISPDTSSASIRGSSAHARSCASGSAIEPTSASASHRRRLGGRRPPDPAHRCRAMRLSAPNCPTCA